MPVLQIERLTFAFPAHWQASKFDDWGFYRNHFVRQRNDIQAVDILALSPDQIAFFIEVKDYRHPQAEKPSALPESIANKVFCTLAALLPARLNGNTLEHERTLSQAVLNCHRLHVVVHIEQPVAHQPKVNLADIKQKLKQLLRAIDAHPKIVSMQRPQTMAWLVTAR